MSRRRNPDETWRDKKDMSYRTVNISKDLILKLMVDTGPHARNDKFCVTLESDAFKTSLSLDGYSIKRIGQLLIDAQRRAKAKDIEKLLAGTPYAMKRS